MGIVNLYRRLNSEREIFNFNGKIRDNLDLDWNYALITKNGEKLTPDYELQENEVLTVQQTPGLVAAAIILGVVSLGVGIGVGVYAYEQAKNAQKEMEEAVAKIKKANSQKDVASIPQLADGRNEKIDGKNVPIILGKHLFAPYFLSDPYMKPEGEDGADLYWYGTFLVGQNGLCFEKIRNGVTELVTFTEDEPQQVNDRRFIRPPNYDPADPPPFYDPENYIDIVQKGNEETSNSFTETVFEERWADSLGGSVELGRKKIDNAKTGNVINGAFKPDENGIFTDDDGAEPVIRETARFPMLAEIEISFPDGLFGWDSKNGIATPASVGVKLEWSKDGKSGWLDIPISFPDENSLTETETIPASRNVADWVDQMIPASPGYGRTLSHTMTLPNGGSYGGSPLMFILFEKELRQENTSQGLTWFTRRRITFVYEDSKKTVKASGTIGGQVIIYGTSSAGNARIARARAAQMRFIFSVTFPPSVYSKAGDPVFIRATRLTRMHTGSYRDRVYLTAIRTRQYNPNTSNTTQLIAAKNINERYKDKFCRMGIKLKVNKNTQEFMDRFNVIASMTGRTWNGQWSTDKTKTSNSAAVLLELITGLIHDTSKHKDTELDQKIMGNKTVYGYTFGKLYEYCANRSVRIEGQSLPQNFTLECNGVLTSGTRKIDAIQSILATCDAGLYVNEFGKLEVYYEDYQVTPIALLNNQRLISMVDQRSLERKSDGYTVEFADQEADWTQKTHRILRPRVKVNPGLNTYSPMKLDFTTSYNQAMWHARRLLAKEEFRPGEIKCTVGKEGRYYKPGSLIKVQNERHKIGLGSGEIIQLIKNGNQIVGLKLMERFDISKDRDYWIEYYVVDEDRNFIVQKQIQSVGEYTDRLMFTVPIDLDDEGDRTNAPVFGNILSTLYAEGLNTGRVWESKRYIVTDLSENQNGYDLSLAEYAEEIYSDSEMKEIKERQSSILSAPPMVLADQERRLQAELIKALQEQTSPPNIDRIASQVFDREYEDNIYSSVGKLSPRYRGGFYVIGLNDGTINNEIMNLNDWVSYLGTTGQWENGYCYQWTADGWKKVIVNADNMGKYTTAIHDLCKGAPNGYFSILFCKTIVTVDALIENLYMQRGIVQGGGVLQSKNYIPDVSGWLLTEERIYAMSGYIGGVDINARTIQVEGKGYLPIGFIYFQLRGQPEPASIFAGTWQNISSEFAGLFFRVEGGNAVGFGNDQGQSIQPHTHTYINNRFGNIGSNGNGSNISSINSQPTADTGSAGAVETRPVNTTIRVWKRTA